MKKIALASAVAIASITAAHAAPTVYGKIFLTGDYFDTNYDSKSKKDDSNFKLNSNASRIGVKGNEPLTANTDLVYQLEYGVDVDANSNGRSDNQQFYSRNTYLALANKQYGTLLAGRSDTPFRLAKGNVDVFNANSSTFGMDRTGPVITANGKTGIYNLDETRANNVIAYKSPKLTTLPITFSVATSLSETGVDGHQVIKTAIPATYNADGSIKTAAIPAVYGEKQTKDNGYSASATYDENGVFIGLGYDNNVDVNDQAWRIAGTVDMGKFNMVQGLTLGAMYQNADIYDNKDDVKTVIVSGKYKVANTPWTAKAQYIGNDFGNNDSSEVVVGGEYTFNKNTTGHVYAGQISRDKNYDETIVGGGLEYKF